MEKGREFPKNIYFCFIYYAKAFDCVDHNKGFSTVNEAEVDVFWNSLAFLKIMSPSDFF